MEGQQSASRAVVCITALVLFGKINFIYLFIYYN